MSADFGDPVDLIERATRKAGLIWIKVPGDPRAYPAWHHWHDGSAYVLTGGSEQPLSWLVDIRTAGVIVPSKDTGGRLLSWTAAVEWLPPTEELWRDVISEMNIERLNSRDSDDQPRRWARESDLIRLTPTGELQEAPGHLSDASGGAPPPASPATTSGPLPYVVGRRLRRRMASLLERLPRLPRS
jgi:hypothetical protein